MEAGPSVARKSLDNENQETVPRPHLNQRAHLNQYEILRTLGHGTHGKVELARNLKTGDFVVRPFSETVARVS